MLEFPKEKWLRMAVVTAATLSLLAAFSALRASGYSARAQLATSREVGAWAQFHNKSLKQSVSEVERDLVQAMMLEAQNPETRGHLDPVLSTCLEEIQRHDKEKADLRKLADDLEKEQDSLRRRAGAFGAALLLFQLAIILTSLSLLLERPQPWLFGTAIGALGLLFVANGFLLVF